jgi:hypothetical protein
MSFYVESLQTLLHTLELNGYVFEKIYRLTPLESYDEYDEEPRYKRNVKAVFKKTNSYEDEDGDIVTSYIRVNVEFDASSVDYSILFREVRDNRYYYNLENTQKIIDKLRQPSDLPNVNVPTRDSNETDDRTPKKELQILFQILTLHDYQYDGTKYLMPSQSKHYATNAQAFFQKMDANIIVKIEFNTHDMEDETLREDVVIDKKTKLKYYYVLKNAQTFVENLIDAPAARGIKNRKPIRKTRKLKGKTLKPKKTRRR